MLLNLPLLLVSLSLARQNKILTYMSMNKGTKTEVKSDMKSG